MQDPALIQRSSISMARPLSDQERAQLLRAQAALLKAEQKLEEQRRRAQLARDRRVTHLLEYGVSAPAIARELKVTRGAVYGMAQRARRADAE